MSQEEMIGQTLDTEIEKIDELYEQAKCILKTAPEKSIEFGKQALALAVLSNRSEKMTAVQDLLGKANEYAGNFPEAINCYQQSLEIYRQLGDQGGVAFSLRNMGNANFHLSRYDQTLEFYNRSLEITDQMADKNGSAGTLNNIGAVYTHINNYDKALEYYLMSLKKMEEVGDKKGIAYTLNNIGVIYKMLKEYGKSLEYYKKSLEIKEEMGIQRDVVGSLNNIGIIYLKIKDYQKAVEYTERSLKLAQEIGDQYTIANALNSLGNIHKESGRHEISMEHFIRANKIFSSIGTNYEIAESLMNIGNSYLALGSYQEAQKYLEQCRHLSQDIKANNYLQECYQIFSDLYSAQGDFRQALEYYKRYSETKDSIFTEESSKKIAEMQTKYETEKKEKEAEIYRLRNVELAEANRVISEAKEEIEEKNRHITSSIEYARRIQQAVLPPRDRMGMALPEHFVLFKPRDIVSGDFYWYSQTEDWNLVAVVDCTGHGVPGAFMSMIGSMLLNVIVNENGVRSPAEILGRMHEEVRTALKQKGEEGEATDGMDVCLCGISREWKRLVFAGAKRPLYLVRNKELIEIAGDSKSVGGRQKEEKRIFRDKQMDLRSGDMLYLSSDGYSDQCNVEGQKMGSRRLKELMMEVSEKSPVEQREFLLTELERHQGAEEQRDDIAIVGVKI
jgi:tetratricopeptide (TPR) repeat protein